MGQTDTADRITIQVCAAWPDRALRQTLSVPRGTSILEIRAHPELSLPLQEAWAQASAVGVFGLPKAADEPLNDGDRVELWRPLIADPKDARRQRAKLRLDERKKARLLERQKARSGSV